MITATYVFKCSIKSCHAESTAQVFDVAAGMRMPMPNLPFGWITIATGGSAYDLCAACAERGMEAMRVVLEGKPVEGIQD